MRFSNESWNMVQIKELCSVVSGGTPSTEESSFWNGNIQWFTPTEVGNYKYVTFSKRTITELGLKKSSAKLLPAGSILLSTRATVGEASICTKECTTNQGFQSLIPNNKCNNEFLYYLVQTKKKEMVKRSCGSTFNEISNSQVGSIKVRIPSIEQQKKISKFLSYIDERIDTQIKIIGEMIALKNEINNIFFDSINSCVRFSELYTFASEGGTPDTTKSEYYLNGTIPFIKIENLDEKYLLSSNSYISEFGLQNSSAWLVPKESILLSNGATIGETAILKIDAATKQGILGIIPKKPYDSEILYYLFKSRRFAKTLKRITTKGTMDAAYLKDINKEKVYLTSDANMNKHVRLMSLIDERIGIECQITNLLVKEKRYLLSNLFI